MTVIDGVNELKNCLEDMPECRRDREVCLGAHSHSMSFEFKLLAHITFLCYR